jgi:hypothetical protein
MYNPPWWHKLGWWEWRWWHGGAVEGVSKVVEGAHGARAELGMVAAGPDHGRR